MNGYQKHVQNLQHVLMHQDNMKYARQLYKMLSLIHILLAFIGGKMLYESIFKKDDETKQPCSSSTKLLIVMAIATSIDALAVGVSLAMLKVNIWMSAGIIGIVTFIICFAGVFIGAQCGRIFKKGPEIAGGIILIIIGIKILVEHLLTE